jgi:hypothetical protein
MIGGNQELNDYVLKAQGIGRKGLNIMCFIGIFIFGWLLAIAFDMLGKKGQGWFYVVPIIGCLVISQQAGPQVGIFAPIIYIIGWIHANILLSLYQSSARNRIAQIDQLSGSESTIDVTLEKGLLQSKVLRDQGAGTATLAQAFQMPGGDGQLLNLAGVQLFATKRYAEARGFFDRAMLSTKDDALIKQIKRNQANVAKKLK